MKQTNYEDLVHNHASTLIEQVVTEIKKMDAVEIHHDYNDNDQWAIVSLHLYEEDKEISIRLHPNDQYDLYFGYYDEDDEFFDIIHPLTPEEKESIPPALRKLLKSVLAKEEGMRVPGNFLGN